MNKSWQHRRPAVFRLDEHVIASPAGKTSGSSGRPVQVQEEPELDAFATADRSVRLPSRGVHWGMLFWSALGALMLLGIGISVTGLIAELFERNRGLGWLGLAFAVLATVSLIVIAVREATGLMRLATVEKLRHRAADMMMSDNRIEARVLVRELLDLTRRMPRLARSRAQLEGHLTDIIDGADMVRLAERELMRSLDQQACTLISATAMRVSVVTALSPRAVIDVLYVLASALGLVRRLAFLYGVRPGTLGLGRLIRLIAINLAMTGGLATTDSLIQQLLGHGVVAKLSARLGEGLLNGLLTARFGLAAVDIIRPMPFAVLPRPKLRDLMSEVLQSFGDSEERQRSPESSSAVIEVR